MNDPSRSSLRNIFRVAFLLSCHIFDCDGSCEDCVAVITERRKRDLNPRAGSPDLLPFQGSPFGQLGYFSMQIPTKVSLYLIIRIRFQRVPFRPNFSHVSSYSLIRSGEDGIRTHVPVRTNGFQDRRVMTTSLPLQTVAQHLLKSWFAFDSLARTNDILTDSHSSVNANFKNYLNKNV